MSKKIARTAIIASLYCALTVLIAPLSYGPVQFRFSECLTVLAVFYPEAVIGLTVGCFFSNLFGNGILDIVFGTLATFLASFSTYLIGKKLKNFSINLTTNIILNVFLNAFLVPVCFALGSVKAYFLAVLTVGVGQVCVLSTLGVLVALAIKKFQKNFNNDFI